MSDSNSNRDSSGGSSNSEQNNYTEEDRDYLAAAIYGEARGEPIEGQIAIGHVVQNRANRTNQTIKATATDRHQFTAFNPSDPNRNAIQAAAQSGSNEWKNAQAVAEAVLSGQTQDPTFGADHYYNPNVANPNWGSQLSQTAVIGGHRFGTLPWNTPNPTSNFPGLDFGTQPQIGTGPSPFANGFAPASPAGPLGAMPSAQQASSGRSDRGYTLKSGSVDVDNLNDPTSHMLGLMGNSAGRGFVVTSGYRSPAVNAAVGGSPTSNHLTGSAIDVRQRDRTPKQNLDMLNAALAGGAREVIFYPESKGGHVHFGTRPNMLFSVSGPVPDYAKDSNLFNHLQAGGTARISKMVPSPTARPANLLPGPGGIASAGPTATGYGPTAGASPFSVSPFSALLDPEDPGSVVMPEARYRAPPPVPAPSPPAYDQAVPSPTPAPTPTPQYGSVPAPAPAPNLIDPLDPGSVVLPGNGYNAPAPTPSPFSPDMVNPGMIDYQPTPAEANWQNFSLNSPPPAPTPAPNLIDQMDPGSVVLPGNGYNPPSPTPAPPTGASGGAVGGFLSGLFGGGNNNHNNGPTSDYGPSNVGSGRRGPAQPTHSYVGGDNSGVVLSSGGGSSGGGGGTVICTYFHQQGDLTDREYMHNVQFSRRFVSDQKMRGYHFWAVPYVELMKKSKLARDVMRPLVKWRTEELAYQIGRSNKPSWKGKLVRLLFEPPSWLFGLFVRKGGWAAWGGNKANV